jgi:hypothetical protein
MDGQENQNCPHPLNPDTDGDGIIDGQDLDPCDPNNPSLTATAIAGAPTNPPLPTQPLPTVPLPTEPLPIVPSPTALPPVINPTQPPGVQPTQPDPVQLPAEQQTQIAYANPEGQPAANPTGVCGSVVPVGGIVVVSLVMASKKRKRNL